MLNLTEQEIKERLIRLRNLEYLHKKAKKRILKQDKEIHFLRLRIKELEDQNKEKDRVIETFRLELEELRIKVFGKKKDKKDKDDEEPKERQKADRDPSSYRRPIPKDEEITKTEEHPIDTCPKCTITLTRKRVVVFYEEEIPLDKPQKEIIKHEVEQGYCNNCHKWYSSYAIPSAKCIIGQKLRKYVCYLSIVLRLSNQQIEDHIRDIHRVQVSQGEISKILEGEAIKLRPEYERLKKRIQKQKAHHYDETSWKVARGKQGNHGWIMAGTGTPEAIFDLGQSRGKGHINDLNGSNNNIGISDDYGAYKNQFTHHQLCWAHPNRKLRDLALSELLTREQHETCLQNYQTFAKIYAELKQTVKTTFDYDMTHEYYLRQITEFAKPNSYDPAKLKTIKVSLLKNKEKYLTCLKFPGLVPLDNNKAERSLRHLVIKRKISYGSKTQKGAETTSILASVLLSLKWMNPKNFLNNYLLLTA